MTSDPGSKPKVLFLCTGNSARSQIAEAFLRKYAGDRFEVFSAGLVPKGINPLTVRVMDELGIALTGQTSKHLNQFICKIDFDYLITVCDSAAEMCPVFPGMGIRLHWSFEDPAALQGTDQEKLAKFRQVRDQISQRIQSWLAELGVTSTR